MGQGQAASVHTGGMKRLLLLLPMLLTASCAGAADITTEEPFQITCTWIKGERSGDETWFIDPKLDVATLQIPGFEGPMDLEYVVHKVTPRKIVLGKEWRPLIDEDGSFWFWEKISVDRSTGEVTKKEFFRQDKSATGYPTAEWKGEEQEVSFGYDCQKPTRE